jgi:hypothetical protein
MMTDFYLRAPGDPNYIDGITLSSNDIENTISQIRMTLLTKKGEVLGEPEFGFDPTKYLFEFEGLDLEPIEKEASNQIQEYVMMSKIYSIRAEAFTLDGLEDIYKLGMGMSISINGVQQFAAFYG